MDYKKLYEESQKENEKLKEENNKHKHSFADLWKKYRELQEQVEAFEKLTGLNRMAICSHANIGDDSHYTYNTYAQYEEDISDYEDLLEELREEHETYVKDHPCEMKYKIAGISITEDDLQVSVYHDTSDKIVEE